MFFSGSLRLLLLLLPLVGASNELRQCQWQFTQWPSAGIPILEGPVSVESGVRISHPDPWQQVPDFNCLEEFSLSMWLLPERQHATIHPESVVTVGDLHIGVDESGFVRLISMSDVISPPLGRLPKSSWSHLTLSSTENNISVFVNGELQNTMEWSAANVHICNNSSVWLAPKDHPTFNGLIQELRAFDSALSFIDVLQLHHASLLRHANHSSPCANSRFISDCRFITAASNSSLIVKGPLLVNEESSIAYPGVRLAPDDEGESAFTITFWLQLMEHPANGSSANLLHFDSRGHSEDLGLRPGMSLGGNGELSLSGLSSKCASEFEFRSNYTLIPLKLKSRLTVSIKPIQFSAQSLVSIWLNDIPTGSLLLPSLLVISNSSITLSPVCSSLQSQVKFEVEDMKIYNRPFDQEDVNNLDLAPPYRDTSFECESTGEFDEGRRFLLPLCLNGDLENDKCNCRPPFVGNHCTRCTSGYFLSSVSSIDAECTKCTAGTFSVSGGSKCIACPLGTFSTQGAASCQNCSAGSIAAEIGSSSCSSCEPGSVAKERSSSCTPCTAGSYAVEGHCERCSPGHFSNSTSSIRCQACPVGTFTSNYSSTTCSACVNGSAALQEGSMQCTSCPAGTFAAQQGRECQLCTLGTFSPFVGSTTCLPCSVGHVAGEMGAIRCRRCEPGTYVSPASAECIPCGIGEYNDDPALNRYCQKCRAGRFGDVHALQNCRYCPAGQFTNTNGSESCQQCSIGFYSVAVGSSECQPCPTSMFTMALGSSHPEQCVCKPGFYGPVQQQCRPCPEGGVCERNGSGVLYPATRAGFWRSEAAPFLISQCSPMLACLPSSWEGEGTACALGYSGQRCGSCSDGYFRVSENCELCPPTAFSLVSLLIVFLLLAFALLCTAAPTRTPLTSGGLTLSYVQVISLMATLPVPWPSSFIAVLNVLSWFNFNVQLWSPQCSLPLSYWHLLALKLLAPLFILGMVWLFSRAYVHFKAGLHSRFVSRRVTYAATLLFLHGYTFLTSTVLDPFQCVALSSSREVSVLVSEPSILCSRSWSWSMLIPIMGFILFVVGTPLAFSCIIFLHCRRSASTSIFDANEFQQHFGCLIAPFKPGYQWWVLVTMARRLVVVGSVNLLNGSNLRFLQLMLTITTLFASLILQACFNPYKAHDKNRLAFVWDLVTIFILFAAVVFEASSGSENGLGRSDELLLSSLVASVFVFAACIACVSLAQELFLRFRSMVKSASISVVSRESLHDSSSFSVSSESASTSLSEQDISFYE